MKYENIKKLTVIALLSGVAFLLMVLEFPIPLVPGFLKMDISEFPALIAAFIMGPVEGIAVCFIKCCLHLTVSYSAGVGELANFLIGAAFVGTAGLIYKYKNNFKGSLYGCIAGSLVMAALSYPINLFIVYPVYSKMIPVDQIIQMYKEILPSVGSLESALFVFNVPFTLVKGIIVSILSLLCYRRLKHLYKS
ncbi:MAG: ECF transporter S component [Eubacteriales bacterium]|nr:ECF transporter S component [Eubacteriales bacterium]